MNIISKLAYAARKAMQTVNDVNYFSEFYSEFYWQL